MSQNPIVIHWFRRDLRLQDNAALYAALKTGQPVIPIFIFDKNILDKLPSDDKRVQFIHNELCAMNDNLNKLGSSLFVFYGKPEEVWKNLVEKWKITQVFTNRDYEPYAQQRDRAVFDFFKSKNIEFKGCKDQVIFEKSEVMKKDGKPYTVFTPYSKMWRKTLIEKPITHYPSENLTQHFIKTAPQSVISLKKMGFEPKNPTFFPKKEVKSNIIENYDKTRNFPAINGTSKLSVHLRFGTISVRQLAKYAMDKNEVFINELIWRDFYQMILFHFPHVVDSAFRAKYDFIEWRNNEAEFKKWCDGKTGYPLVDAGMRELNETGYMHNRVRMVVASFLTKHLLIDWRWGEQYFAEKLLDFDLAANNGGWQWASGSGCDAAPYFRIFNPTSQLEKFDKNYEYVKRWVPEFGTPTYPEPMVEHKFARQRTLDTYKAGLAKAEG